MATTSALANLKLTTARKSLHINPIQQRRNKLVRRIWEQIELLKCQAAGTQFVPIKYRTVRDAETGVRRQVEVPKRVKSWVFTAENGKTPDGQSKFPHPWPPQIPPGSAVRL